MSYDSSGVARRRLPARLSMLLRRCCCGAVSRVRACAFWLAIGLPWLLLGLTLLVGAFVRLAAFFGALQMILFWAAHLQGGLMAGFPIEHGFFVSSHIVYAILLFGLGAIGAGRILGVDAWLEEQEFVESMPVLRVFLG